MSNKATAEQWLTAVGGCDPETMRSLMTDDAVHQFMGTSLVAGERNVDEFIEMANRLFAVTRDGLEFTFLNFTAEEDRVAVEFEGRSELVNGVAYNNVYHLLFHFRDGKIRRIHEYADSKIVDEAVGPLLAG